MWVFMVFDLDLELQEEFNKKIRIIGIGEFGAKAINEIKESLIKVNKDTLCCIIKEDKVSFDCVKNYGGINIYIYDINEDKELIEKIFMIIDINCFNVSIVEDTEVLPDIIKTKSNSIIKASKDESASCALAIKAANDIIGLTSLDIEDILRILGSGKYASYIRVEGTGFNRSIDTANEILGVYPDIKDKYVFAIIYGDRNISLKEMSNTISRIGNIKESVYAVIIPEGLSNKYIVNTIVIDKNS